MTEMNLKEFVSSSITEIVEGVADAIDKTKDLKRSFVNPTQRHASYSDATEINFDVAVTVMSQTGSEGKARISVFGAQLGGGVDSATENQEVSRLCFKVPVAWPSVAVSQYPSNEGPIDYGKQDHGW